MPSAERARQMETGNRVIALGFFDGVHLGHAALLEMTKRRAAEKGLAPAVLSFDIHPQNAITGKRMTLISSPADRTDIIHRLFGIEDVLYMHFDERFMRMGWREFIDHLYSDFGARHLVAGHDYTFGYKGEGTVQRLMEYGAELGIGVDIIPEIRLDGVTVSSTYIRKLLMSGDLDGAEKYLGHPFSFTDSVRQGYKFGRTIGAPTINMRFPEDVIELRHGVYATKVYIPALGDGAFSGVTNVGERPTLGGGSGVTVESYLLDFSRNVYGMQVRVEFYRFLRPEIKFDNPEQLKEQIQRDAQTVREYFAE